MIVLDASVLCELVTGGENALEAVRKLAPADPRNDYEDAFHCPALIEVETLHALRGMERGGVLTRAEAERAVRDLDDIRMVRHPFGGVVARRAWALRHNLSIYDASYVALAELLDESILLTADAGLASVTRAALGEARVQLVA
jgi:predicted nucleic acid-binding protein